MSLKTHEQNSSGKCNIGCFLVFYFVPTNPLVKEISLVRDKYKLYTFI